jgi:hypothetical protein
MLIEAHTLAKCEDTDKTYPFTWKRVPEVGLRKLVPKIDGMDTSVFQGWDGRQQNSRKCLHGEVEESEVPFVHSLVEEVKSRGILAKYFGPMARLAVILEAKWGGGGRSSGDRQQSHKKVGMAAMVCFSRKHINYQANTSISGLRGIFNVDKAIPIFSVSDPSKTAGVMSLRRILYTKLLMSDGNPLFLEVHQADPMNAVDVVVPNCEEAERMLLMMNKNAAAYLVNFLVSEAKMDADFVSRMVRAVMDPGLVNAIDQCTWDKETRVLTTPEDAENERMDKLEEAAWYKDEFGDHMVDTSRKEKKKFAGKEALDELNCDYSFKSVHYKTGTGGESLDLGSKRSNKLKDEVDLTEEVEEAEGDGTNEGGIDYSGLSSAELIALLQKHKIAPGKTGSPPTGNSTAGTGGGEEESDEESLSSDSSDSDDDSDSESEMDVSSSPSGAEGNTANPKPVSGE